MDNICLLEKYAEMRQKEYQEAAHLARLIQEIEAEKPKFWHKWAGKVGDWMVAFGHRLREDNLNPMEVDYGTLRTYPEKRRSYFRATTEDDKT